MTYATWENPLVWCLMTVFFTSHKGGGKGLKTARRGRVGENTQLCKCIRKKRIRFTKERKKLTVIKKIK